MADEATKAREAARGLATVVPMRRATVSERWVKCGKAGCRCATDGSARHGPYWMVKWVQDGKTHSRWVKAEEVALVREQIEAGRHFDGVVAETWEACTRWADAELVAHEAASREAAKKGGSRQTSKPKRPPK
jgi:hypothetical protein